MIENNKYCSQCGALLPADAQYCTKCGKQQISSESITNNETINIDNKESLEAIKTRVEEGYKQHTECKSNANNKPMSGCQLGCGCIALIFFIAIVLASCNSPDTQPQTQTPNKPNSGNIHKAISLIKHNERQFPVGGGYNLISVKAVNGIIKVSYSVPNNIIDAVNDPNNDSTTFSKIACPSEHEEIWNLISSNNVEIELYSRNKHFVASAYCSSN